MRQLLIIFIKFYRLIFSPFLGRNCRFYPTCSQYAIDALQEHGALGGSVLTVKRLGKCHPWHEGGYDPVPKTQQTVNK